MNQRSQLPRLAEAAYRGFVSVHWIHTIHQWETNWLSASFHAGFREALLHSLSHFDLGCPAYCLMPDHIHILTSGLRPDSDQQRFNRRLRTDLNRLLHPCSLQKQAYDHVLRDDEIKDDAFATIARYILHNPVRAGLGESFEAYPYSGAIIPGYFALDPRNPDFWETYWSIHNRMVQDRWWKEIEGLATFATCIRNESLPVANLAKDSISAFEGLSTFATFEYENAGSGTSATGTA